MAVPIPPSVLFTLGEKIASLSLAQLRNVYAKRAWMANCARAACNQADAPYAWRPVARWLGEGTTWELLRQSDPGMEERIVASLQSALHPRATLHPRRWATQRRRELARQLVPIIADTLLRYAPVNLALDRLGADVRQLQHGVARIADDVGVVRSLIDTDDWDDVLADLPLGVRLRLQQLEGSVPAVARELGRRLRDGRASPKACLRALTTPVPTFLQNAPSHYVIVLAEYAISYGAREEAYALFEQAAKEGLEAARSWTRAAMAAQELSNSTRARELLKLAMSMDPTDHLAPVILAGLDDDVASAEGHATALADLASRDPIAGIVGSRALWLLNKRPAAIAALRTLLHAYQDHTTACLDLARLLQQEAALRPQLDRTRLLSQALGLALRARDERRRVLTDSSEAVIVAAEILLQLDRDRDAVLVCTTSEHNGSANDIEGNNPNVRAMAVEAALDAGDVVLAQRLLQGPGELAHRPLIQARLALQGIDGTKDDAIGILLAAYDHTAPLVERLRVLELLAAAGAAVLPDIDEIMAADPATADRMLATSEIERGLYETAIQRLRARRPYPHSLFPRLVARAYERMGDLDSAIVELEQAASDLLDPALRMRAAVLLVQVGRADEAEREAMAVLAELPPESVISTDARRWLLERAWADARWDAVERHARMILTRRPEEVEAAWALIGALHNSARDDLAWDEYQRHQPPIERPEQAAGWLHIAAAAARPEEWVPQALDVAATFQEDAEVAAAFLHTSVFIPDDAPLPEGVKQGIRDRNAAIIEGHGERIGVRQVSVDELPKMVEEMSAGFRADAQRIETVLNLVRRRGAPLGFLAQVARRPYSEVLLRRGAGCIPAVSPAGNSRDVALAALGADVAIDVSAVVVGSALGDIWGQLTQQFRRIFFAQAQRRDLAATEASLRAPTAATLGWDSGRGQVGLTMVDHEALLRLRERVDRLSSMANAFPADSESGIPDFADLGAEAEPWLSSAQTALRHEIPLWADDLGLRAIAAERGVISFGTLDVVLALHARDALTDDVLNDAVLLLARASVVDLSLTDQAIVHLATEDGWRADGAALPFMRPAFWVDPPRAARLLSVILGNAARQAETALGAWLCAAAVGFGSSVDAPSASLAIARLLTTAFLQDSIQPRHAPTLLAGARVAAAELNAADPLGSAVKEFHAVAVQRFGAAQGAAYVTQLLGELQDDDRDIVRRAVFDG